MRLLRLDFRDPKATLDIHPLLTVVSAQDSAIQPPLYAALRRLSRGETMGLRGLIQHGGLLFELNPALDRPFGVVSPPEAVVIPVDAVSPRTAAALGDELQHWESQAVIDRLAADDLASSPCSTRDQIEAADREANRSTARLRSLEAKMERIASGQPARSERDVLEPVSTVVSQLAGELSGSTPVAVVGNFSGLGQGTVQRLFETFSELARQVQMIVITDNTAAAYWVREAGPQIAMVSRSRSFTARPIKAKR